MQPGEEDKREEVLSRLKDQLRLKVNLGFKVTVHPFGVVPRYEVKAKRFKDLRKH